MQKKPKSYSAALMDQIPIKYLVTQAQGLQQELGGEMRSSRSVDEAVNAVIKMIGRARL